MSALPADRSQSRARVYIIICAVLHAMPPNACANPAVRSPPCACAPSCNARAAALKSSTERAGQSVPTNRTISFVCNCVRRQAAMRALRSSHCGWQFSAKRRAHSAKKDAHGRRQSIAKPGPAPPRTQPSMCATSSHAARRQRSARPAMESSAFSQRRQPAPWQTRRWRLLPARRHSRTAESPISSDCNNPHSLAYVVRRRLIVLWWAL
jgi:hypothetical protein